MRGAFYIHRNVDLVRFLFSSTMHLLFPFIGTFNMQMRNITMLFVIILIAIEALVMVFGLSSKKAL